MTAMAAIGVVAKGLQHNDTGPEVQSAAAG
jgi:hypothetical protein